MQLTNPWFWAFLAMFGWFLGLLVVGSRTFGSRLAFGTVCLVLAEVPRVLLPLPFVEQPRLEGDPFLPVLGAIILVGSLFFGTPVFRIRPLTRPDSRETLRTDGLYSIVRHPLMVCDSFWPLGWSLLWDSLIGVFLTPVWFVVSYLLTFLEEEKLINEYGEQYRRYQQRVPRIIPFFGQR